MPLELASNRPSERHACHVNHRIAINGCACEEARKRLGLTQLQFAKTLGVSFQSVNRWERGRTKPLPIVLKQIEVMVKEMGDRGPIC
jgi:DNA-binding transcriptional regulator YiaG